MLQRVLGKLSDTPGARVMLQLPTGGGKTRIAGQLLSQFLSGGRKAVWLTHRRELAAQTEGMLKEDHVTATKDMNWTPGTMAPALPNSVVILMAQTVSRRTARSDVWGKYDKSDLMIIDEAHHATAEGWTRAIRQWPGAVLGMTATPWRLSRREGFDHLFAELVCGPQVVELQSGGWLCGVRVMSPPEGDLVLGGSVDATGDFSEPGIEEANRDRDIWTGGALRFWQRHGEDRQTVVYAVSVRHAKNLADVFNNAGIPAGALVADTPEYERAGTISRFQSGSLRALINVAVATEGFDLPDAACVLLTRPTMSLALYLQMVGRGLRPKPKSGDCIVLDLAGNSLMHGLPDSDREWSLKARGEQQTGDAPLTRCERCEALSAAGSHNCDHCGEPFGEDCSRCGAWRAWKRWTLRSMCVEEHDEVCDLCHYDAHLLANLPVTKELEELSKMTDDDELSPYRDPYLKTLLEEERRRLGGTTEARKAELRSRTEDRESALADDDTLDNMFEYHLATLPTEERPRTRPQERRLFNEWENGLKRELEEWNQELGRLEVQSVDGQLILGNVRDRLLRLLEAEAREAGLLARVSNQEEDQERRPGESADGTSGNWLQLAELARLGREGATNNSRPHLLKLPDGSTEQVKNWIQLIAQIAEWFVREGKLSRSKCPVRVGGMRKRYLIHVESKHGDGSDMIYRTLSNGLFLEAQLPSRRIAWLCELLATELGGDPSQFSVQLSG
ncbi:MAG: DEAD/DEAH box helicase family protein [Chloroflexota bacterium]|nr:DEAD/DEAH box helicase family protein [Chloroflexota bacterium]